MHLLEQCAFAIGRIVYKLDRCKALYLRHRINKAVNNCGGYISERCNVGYPSHITIGKNSYINGGDIIASKNAKIVIGDNCLISYNVHLRTDMHEYKYKNVLINQQGHTEKDIIVEEDCWIGFGAQIMPGVTVGRGAIIGAGAVLTKDAEPYGIYIGVPAGKIKERTASHKEVEIL